MASESSHDATEENLTDSQLAALDDTDCYSTVWQDALTKQSFKWGGRGQGGRGTARRTFQRKDIVVDNIRLEYVASTQGSSKLMLEGALLKLLSGRIYGLVGNSGCGKSSLLKRIHAGKIPGFPPHISTLYVNQNRTCEDDPQVTPLLYIVNQHSLFAQSSSEATQSHIDELEQAMDLLDVTSEDDQQRIETIGEEIGRLEDEISSASDAHVLKEAKEALRFMGVHEALWNDPMASLSPGLRQKTILAAVYVCRTDLLLLDQPSHNLDVRGLLQLRQLIALCTLRRTTIVLTSCDADLVNDVCSDILEMTPQLTLAYYPGNYNNYCYYRHQNELNTLRQSASSEKKRAAMTKTLNNLKKQPAPRRGGNKKKGRHVESYRKRMEREGKNVSENAQASTDAIDTSKRRGMTTQQLLKLNEKAIQPPPKKAVQFSFRNPSSQWGEPLIMALDVGHGYGTIDSDSGEVDLLFDCVDMSIDEGRTYCILGETRMGKSTFLRILAGLERSRLGGVKKATQLDVGFIDVKTVDDLVAAAPVDDAANALSLLERLFPDKSEQDIRGELTSFGISPKQASTRLRYLSGGELRRLAVVVAMLRNPQVLIFDEPTMHLDVESIEALAYGLRNWQGTVIVSSHDASFVRSLDPICFVIADKKLQRVAGGIDRYLRAFAE